MGANVDNDYNLNTDINDINNCNINSVMMKVIDGNNINSIDVYNIDSNIVSSLDYSTDYNTDIEGKYINDIEDTTLSASSTVRTNISNICNNISNDTFLNRNIEGNNINKITNDTNNIVSDSIYSLDYNTNISSNIEGNISSNISDISNKSNNTVTNINAIGKDVINYNDIITPIIEGDKNIKGNINSGLINNDINNTYLDNAMDNNTYNPSVNNNSNVNNYINSGTYFHYIVVIIILASLIQFIQWQILDNIITINSLLASSSLITFFIFIGSEILLFISFSSGAAIILFTPNLFTNCNIKIITNIQSIDLIFNGSVLLAIINTYTYLASKYLPEDRFESFKAIYSNGFLFLSLQIQEYRSFHLSVSIEYLFTVSIFITSLHFSHLLIGIILLSFIHLFNTNTYLFGAEYGLLWTNFSCSIEFINYGANYLHFIEVIWVVIILMF